MTYRTMTTLAKRTARSPPNIACIGNKGTSLDYLNDVPAKRGDLKRPPSTKSAVSTDQEISPALMDPWLTLLLSSILIPTGVKT